MTRLETEMAELSLLREQAERALRLAADSTDPELIEQLKKVASVYKAQAEAQEKHHLLAVPQRAATSTEIHPKPAPPRGRI